MSTIEERIRMLERQMRDRTNWLEALQSLVYQLKEKVEVEEEKTETVWGLYEEKYPIYTSEEDAHPSLSYPITVDEANAMVRRIKVLEQELEEQTESEFYYIRCLRDVVGVEEGVSLEGHLRDLLEERRKEKLAYIDMENKTIQLEEKVEELEAERDNHHCTEHVRVKVTYKAIGAAYEQWVKTGGVGCALEAAIPHLTLVPKKE